MIEFIQAETSQQLETVRELLREYERELGVDLCFQGFAAELDGLPGSYAPPAGRLLLALHQGTPIGCVALQAIDTRRVEMKRLFLRPIARGAGAGRALVTKILHEAQAIGYEEIVLDTLPSMVEAQQLYAGFGFRDIAPYRPNPIVGSRYMGRRL